MAVALPIVPLSLADVPPGTTARVAAVDPESPIGRRLLDLGFVAGTEVRVIRRAPFGDPVEYELRGYRVCLRRSEALRIGVELA
jgi:ferrous iron transport protein A